MLRAHLKAFYVSYIIALCFLINVVFLIIEQRPLNFFTSILCFCLLIFVIYADFHQRAVDAQIKRYEAQTKDLIEQRLALESGGVEEYLKVLEKQKQRGR